MHLGLRLAVIVAALGAVAGARADSMRCGSRLVSEEDSIEKVIDLCGEPSERSRTWIVRQPRFELHGNEYVLLTGGYLHDLWRLPPLLGKKIYVVAQVEAAKVGGEPGWASDVAVGLVAQTMFGPLFVGGSVGDEGHRRWFFKLGRVF